MKRGLLSLTALALVLGLVFSPASAVGRSNAQPFRLTSSLDGKKVLPIKSRWLAFPKVQSAKVADVSFLIDGRVRCVERYAPYNYGSDDLNGHLGWLVTTWLTPGKHRFTVRATLTNGKRASHTVVARVLPAPEPPGALAGRWQRTVTDANLPTGKWELVFDRVGIWELDPIDSGIVEHATFEGETISVDAALWMTPYVDGRGKPPVNRFGHRDFGAGWREDGPPARYRWSSTGDRLTLTVIKETSGPDLMRRAVWEGTWTKAT